MARMTIERMAYGPEAIGHDEDGKTVFVSGGVPGDVVEVEVTTKGRSFDRGRVTAVLAASPERVSAGCPYAEVCGGCPWSSLSDRAQLMAKRACVVDSLVRVGHLPAPEAEGLVSPTERPSSSWGYRNKIELAAHMHAGKVRIGLHARAEGGFVRVSSCPLFDDRRNKVIKSVSGALSYLCNSNGIRLERVGIRSSRRTRDLEVALWTPTGPFPRAQVAKVLKDAVPATSVVRVLTKGPSKARRVCGVERLSGKGSWTERIAGGRMSISAPSFFQVNTEGAERLVDLVLDALVPTADDEAMDLYCGAGTFTLPLGRAAGYVEAVESSGPAVRDLRRNLDHAGLDNVEPTGGDAGREFPELDADIIVVDPPRAGLSQDVVSLLSEQPARSIAYVSCDPATLARDLARFIDIGRFRPTRIVPVDLFPQTYHVETVTTLSRA